MRSAQQKFNDGLTEIRATREALKEFVDAAYQNYGTHSYSSGYLESTIIDLIMMLPKAKRAEMRVVFKQQAERQAKEKLLKVLA
jgi:hypothetical protein